MKVTKELKDLISRKLRDQEAEKRNEIFEERSATVAKLNEDLIASEEFKALINAAEKWERFVDSVAKANDEIASRNCADGRYGSTLCAWNMSSMLKAQNVEPLLTRGDNNVHLEFLDKQDAIIMRLSYGKDFDEAKTILAEYGITL